MSAPIQTAVPVSRTGRPGWPAIRVLLGLGAILATGTSNAALHEIHSPVSDPLYTGASAVHSPRAAESFPPLPGTDSMPSTSPLARAQVLKAWHPPVEEAKPAVMLQAAHGQPDLYAALDAPYASDIMTTEIQEDRPDSDLWTVLLVIFGLVAYQLRRKSRAGAIRVRPASFIPPGASRY